MALALTTKLVAAGYLAAASAAAAFCAIPITWVLIAVVGALVGLCAYMASATKHTAALSDEMGKLREKGDDLRATDRLRMERLQQLADKEKLNNRRSIPHLREPSGCCSLRRRWRDVPSPLCPRSAVSCQPEDG